MTDFIIQCKNCHAYKHRSAFSVGRRFCSDPACIQADAMIEVDLARQTADKRQAILIESITSLLDDEKPPHIDGRAWRILHMRSEGMSIEHVAITLNMSESRVRHEEQKAMWQLSAVAKKRIEAVN